MKLLSIFGGALLIVLFSSAMVFAGCPANACAVGDKEEKKAQIEEVSFEAFFVEDDEDIIGEGDA